jgi:hypothetical protein
MSPHEKAILQITALGESLIHEGTSKGDQGLIAIGLSLRLFMATAVNGDFEEFIEHIHSFVEKKLKERKDVEDSSIDRTLTAIKFINKTFNMN